MPTREIITLQLGHYSNFVGTHWWNLQESNFSYDSSNPSEINHDVLYREGESPRREVTYTPRLLLADLKGSLGYLNEQGYLYNDPATSENTSTCLWDEGNLEIKKEEAANQPPFIQSLNEPSASSSDKKFDFENDVNSWVDYLVPRFNPRTVNVIREYEHQSATKAFDIFHYGRNLWQEEQFSDEFSDKIRQYAEECDMMQGFQVLLDSSDGFAGLGASCIEHLRDEYGKSILAFPLINQGSSEMSVSSLIRAVNTALCWQQLGEHASLFSPLSCDDSGWLPNSNPRSFKHLSYNVELKYQTSAILATALDTLSLRYRHKEHTLSALSDLCADLNKMGRRAAATCLNLPFPMLSKTDFIDVLDDMQDPLWTSLTPSCKILEDRSMYSLGLRGIPKDRLKRPMMEAKKQMGKPAYRCSTVHEMMTMYLAYTCHASPIYLVNIDAPLKVPPPFPKIFNNNVHENGNISGWPVGEDVKSVAVLAGLHSGRGISQMFESLHNQISKIRNIKKFHTFEDSGLEPDDFTECLSSLLDSKESFEDNYI